MEAIIGPFLKGIPTTSAVGCACSASNEVRQGTWSDANDVATACDQAHNQQQFGIGPSPHTAMSKTLNRCEVLAKIDRDIADGERHVAEQIALIKWMGGGPRHDRGSEVAL